MRVSKNNRKGDGIIVLFKEWMERNDSTWQREKHNQVHESKELQICKIESGLYYNAA
jgi:hypothetical protein